MADYDLYLPISPRRIRLRRHCRMQLLLRADAVDQESQIGWECGDGGCGRRTVDRWIRSAITVANGGRGLRQMVPEPD